MSLALDWREADGIRWLEADLGNAKAAFSTRGGGVSAAPYDSLNLGILTDDDQQHVRDNRAKLATALGRKPDNVVFGRQVHGGDIETRTAPNTGTPTDADGQLTSDPDLTPLVLVADCIPLALAGDGAVAMVHCGWRGTAAGIVERAVAMLPGEVSAAIGPGIGPCCYEVGDEVLDAFRTRGHDPQRMLDLAAIVAAELRNAGVAPDAIVLSDYCTACNADLFFSHRRDAGVTGRQAGLAWLV